MFRYDVATNKMGFTRKEADVAIMAPADMGAKKIYKAEQDIRQLAIDLAPILPECIQSLSYVNGRWIFFTTTQEGADFEAFKKEAEEWLPGQFEFKTAADL